MMSLQGMADGSFFWIAAVSCSSTGYWLGGVKMGIWWRANWAVQGIGAWVVHGIGVWYWPDLGDSLEMTTFKDGLVPQSWALFEHQNDHKPIHNNAKTMHLKKISFSRGSHPIMTSPHTSSRTQPQYPGPTHQYQTPMPCTTHAPMPCTAQLARCPRPKSRPSGT